MSTTRYVTATGDGIITIIARAIDPEGNPIIEQVSLNGDPAVTRSSPRNCWQAKFGLSTPQNNRDSACAQFGVANTYYIGKTPRNEGIFARPPIYTTDDCSNLATDGFYKTDGDGWINISGGYITQRGSCSEVLTRGPAVKGIDTVREKVKEVINRFGNVDATATAARRILAEQATGGTIGVPPIPTEKRFETIERFVVQRPFTEPSPSTTPPDIIPKYANEKEARRAAKVQQLSDEPIISVAETTPIMTTTTQILPGTPSVFVPAETRTRTRPELDSTQL